jgi:exopolyphosphatase/guanosine-5'-triphosphate,3'-diphosphate pyrophosphatase
VAVVDIGATSIRMAIGEIDPAGGVRTLETLAQAVSLGKDTFSEGAIRKSTIEECVRVLKSYRQKLAEYQISLPERIRIVATSAVREARNRLAFIDRIYVATGLEIEPLDEAEVNRVTFLGVQRFLRRQKALAAARTVVVEVGGGSTEMLVVQGGNVLFARTFRLGTLRLRRTLEAYSAPSGKVRQIMESQIRRAVDEMTEMVGPHGPVQLIALGSDMRFAARHLLPEWEPDELTRVPVDALEPFMAEIVSLSDDQLVHRHHLSFPEAETVGPALLTYVLLARSFGADQLLVTNTNLRDGLLHEMARRNTWTPGFRQQIIRSARNLGRKYDFDEPHAQHVAKLASSLFEQLRQEHQLESQHEVLLHVAALLHEIGGYVSNRSMHKHSMYLIRNSEVFGLGKRNLLLVALVARYHRRASPQPGHEGYGMLDREQRVAVAKMAALLRVAVALDESRSQRIHDFKCKVEDARLVIEIPRAEDLSLEQLALKQNGSLFDEVFGLPLLLRVGR